MERTLKKTDTLSKYPLSAAQQCIQNYRDKMQELGVPAEKIVKAYLIKAIDIFSTLGIEAESYNEMEYHHMRVYIGMLDAPNPEGNIHKLFLVPVDENGSDVIPFGQVNPENPDEMSYVYDFNTPCPKTCDTKSPLYDLGLNG